MAPTNQKFFDWPCSTCKTKDGTVFINWGHHEDPGRCAGFDDTNGASVKGAVEAGRVGHHQHSRRAFVPKRRPAAVWVQERRPLVLSRGELNNGKVLCNGTLRMQFCALRRKEGPHTPPRARKLRTAVPCPKPCKVLAAKAMPNPREPEFPTATSLPCLARRPE